MLESLARSALFPRRKTALFSTQKPEKERTSRLPRVALKVEHTLRSYTLSGEPQTGLPKRAKVFRQRSQGQLTDSFYSSLSKACASVWRKKRTRENSSRLKADTAPYLSEAPNNVICVAYHSGQSYSPTCLLYLYLSRNA